MKVTLSAAMRARDVSRPRAADEEAAREAANQPPPAGNTRARPERAEPGSRPERAEPSGRPAAGKVPRNGRRKRR